MLVVTNQSAGVAISGIHMHRIDEGSSFLLNVARNLFSSDDLTSCWYPEDDLEGSTDELFTEAQRDIIDGTTFDSTRLGKLMYELLPVSKGIVFWYGDEYQNLPCVFTGAEAVAAVQSQLAVDAGEVYLRFSCPKLA